MPIGIHVLVHVYVWKPEVDFMCLLLLLSIILLIYYFEIRLLVEPVGH